MINPAAPQFDQPNVPAPLGGTQTQFVATTEEDAVDAANEAIAAYKAGDPPAGVWFPDAGGQLQWHPANTLV